MLDRRLGVQQLFLGHFDFLGPYMIVDLSQVDEALDIGGERGAGLDLRSGFQLARPRICMLGRKIEQFLEQPEIKTRTLKKALEHGVLEIRSDRSGIANGSEIVAPEVDENAHRRRRKKLIHVPARVLLEPVVAPALRARL